MPLALIGLVCPTHIAVVLQRSTSTTSCWSAPMLECSSRNSNNSFVCSDNFEGAWYRRCSSSALHVQTIYLSTILLSSQSWPMLLVLGGASPVLLINRKSTRSSNEVSEIDSCHQTFLHLPNCVVQQMINCFSMLPQTESTYCTTSYQCSASQNYNLRQRRHNLEFPSKSGHLRDCNFIQGMLFLDWYWRLTLLF